MRVHTIGVAYPQVEWPPVTGATCSSDVCHCSKFAVNRSRFGIRHIVRVFNTFLCVTMAVTTVPTQGGLTEKQRNALQLQALDEVNESPLFRRRVEHKHDDLEPLDSTGMALGSGICSRCGQGFGRDEQIVNCNNEVWHPQCFVCAQCFQCFPDGVFYEYDGRKYCEHDFNVLFAPCCAKCDAFIIGRVIKAMNLSWHPNCFLCELCSAPLADTGFIKNAGRALCHECNAKEKALGMGKYFCHKCHSVIEEGHIKFKGEAFHPYHFNCFNCSVELTVDSREKDGELYCLRCHDKMGIPICGACRRPIEERIVHALGKAWHPEHFVCNKCEKPFYGHRHYEKKGLAYCEIHYHQLFGNMCFSCNNVVVGAVFSALNKSWCTNHFACYVCERKMTEKTKFFEFDLKPICKTCYEKFPVELKKRLKKNYEQSPKK